MEQFRSFNQVNYTICGVSLALMLLLAISLPFYKRRKKQIRMLAFAANIETLAMLIAVVTLLLRYYYKDFNPDLDFTRIFQSISYQFFFGYLCFDDEENFIPGDFAKSFGLIILFVGFIVIGFSPIKSYLTGVEILTLLQIGFMVPIMITVHGSSGGMKKLLLAMTFPFAGLLVQIFVPALYIDYFTYPLALLVAFTSYQVQLEHKLTESEKNLADTKVQILLEQIQPHFIFNSLSAIEELCLEDPEKASKCVHDFSGYLRTSLDSMIENRLIPLEDEIENVKQYVALEKADSSCEFEVHYSLKVVNVMVPVLSVEPLVENAIRHGIAASGKGSNVWIESVKKGDEVLIKVRDDGAGLGITDMQKKRRGIGLENVRRRLEAQCGGYVEHEILDVGTEAVIHIPFKQ